MIVYSLRKIRLLFTFLATLALLCACADSAEQIAHNNPERYTLANDVLWASPRGFKLTMDIYTPTGVEGPLPVIVMFHGGGWLVNDKSIMNQAAAYLATNGRYVVCNVNYRLLGDLDNSVTMNEIVEDAFGAVLWVKQHISTYAGDPANVIVTGDSAGGHLAAMVVNSGHNLVTGGFTGDALGFEPTYMPPGFTAEQIAAEAGLNVQAAILSYGAFDLYTGALEGFESFGNPFWLMGGALPRGVFGAGINVEDNAAYYQAVSPAFTIPQARERALPPQLLTVGSEDALVTPQDVKRYRNALTEAGHQVSFWEHAGRPHAYLDSGSNLLLGIAFEQDAPPALEVMLTFLDELFYSKPVQAQ